MYKLFYDEKTESITEISPKGIKRTIADEFPSEPIFSPNNKKAIYISPLEWECPGSLYLYNLENGEIQELVSQNSTEQTHPKYAIWIDDNTIAIIIGFSYGTVSIGGNVFVLTLNNNVLKQITDYPGKIQITKVHKKNNILNLTGIEYIDEELNEYKEFEDSISLNEI